MTAVEKIHNMFWQSKGRSDAWVTASQPFSTACINLRELLLLAVRRRRHLRVDGRNGSDIDPRRSGPDSVVGR